MFRKTLLLVLIIASGVYQAPEARADLCSKDPTDPYFIKKIDLGQNFVRLKLCLIANPNTCETIGDRYYGNEELSSNASSLKHKSEAQSGLMAAWAGGATYTFVKGTSRKYSPHPVERAVYGAVAGGIVAFMTSFPVSALLSTAPDGTYSINPLTIYNDGTLLDTLAKDPSKGCTYVSGKTRIREIGRLLNNILRHTERNPRVFDSDHAKASSYGAGAVNDPFEPYDPIKASASPAK